MSHFNKKSLIFYAVAIGSVITLFSIVTAYGEANLKTAKSVAGTYRLQIKPQSGCSTPPKLDLTLEQSGVYVTATLRSEAQSASKNQAALSGRWRSPRLDLIGQGSLPDLCLSSSKISSRPRNVQIQLDGQVTDAQVTGQIKLGNNSQTLAFSGQKRSAPTDAAEPVTNSAGHAKSGHAQ
jgi:hypothetical protein